MREAAFMQRKHSCCDTSLFSPEAVCDRRMSVHDEMAEYVTVAPAYGMPTRAAKRLRPNRGTGLTIFFRSLTLLDGYE
ncbi:MAG: hypothetical protein K9G60_03315 [Pseudolabrys sp.]|nr:hypothetical protein [Pseudolabrys sp.]